ncbi:MAG: SpoIIE family protein phosphatase [Motilibacteraceae bacterium]
MAEPLHAHAPGPETGRGAADAWAGELLASLGFAELRAALESSPSLITVTVGPDHLLAYQNEACRRMFGDAPLGEPVQKAFGRTAGRGSSAMDEVLRTGRTMDAPRPVIGLRDVSGHEVLLSYRMAPLGPPGELPARGLVITATDVTGAALAEQAAQRESLLGSLSAALVEAPDARTALQALATALVPEVADVAAVFVLTPPESAAIGAPAPAPDPDSQLVGLALSDPLSEIGPPPPTRPRPEPGPWDTAVNAGRTVLIPVDVEDLSVVAPDPDVAAWLTVAQANCIALVPLVVAGTLTGALVLLSVADRAPYVPEDVPFLEDVAARAGAAVGHVATVRRQRQVALDLQRALLPAVPARQPDVTVAARYVAGVADVEVGGDWWDVHDLGAGRLAVGVGDVSGRGIAAAAVMGQARAAMRAAGHAGLPPAAVLELLDAHVADDVDPEHDPESSAPPRFATACYAVLDPSAGLLTVANAGHTPFLVKMPDGSVRTVAPPPGPPLGLRLAGYTDVTVPFPAGSTLVMFTDGLVESRELELDEGLARLAEHVRALDEPDLEAVADALLDAATREPGHGADDIALLLLRTEPAAALVARLDERVHSVADAPRARRAVRDLALSVAADDAAVQAIEQVTAELVANALEHADPPVELHAHATGTRLVVEVSDRGRALPRPRVASSSDESGRGLAITQQLAHRWGSRTTRIGKVVWAEVLLEQR